MGPSRRRRLRLYLYYGVIAGTGAGIIYISCVANAVKWFPDRRGLAVGLTAAGFGGGAALTIMPIASSIHSMGWAKAMAGLGDRPGHHRLHRGHDTPPSAVRLGACRRGTSAQELAQGRRAVEGEFYLDRKLLSRPEFYLLYAMFFFACAGGLIATGNLSQIAKSLHVSDAKVWGFAIVPLAATLTSLATLCRRIVWGTVSDWLGREYTMFLTFGVEAVLVFLVTRVAGSPIGFRGAVLVRFPFLGRDLIPCFRRRRATFSVRRTLPPTMAWCIRPREWLRYLPDLARRRWRRTSAALSQCPSTFQLCCVALRPSSPCLC